MQKRNNENILRMSNKESNKLSRECLQVALVKLMSLKKFENITITELVKQAGVSRNAFYRNYSSKEDIILEICNNIINTSSKLINLAKSEKNRYRIIHDLFVGLKENAKTLNLLYQTKLYNYTIFNEEKITENVLNSQSINEQYKVLGVNCAIYAIIQKWIKDGMKEDIDFMTELCFDILNKFYGTN